ncbi:uncharacterized protein LOC127874474 [Dreissena polymorpha]|nr:uncharacterized protein LOC127874474 [Dreissena polymorpha]XP_052274791.1 uncharacterized protein LOC127874474 [Dreissena polymorpha]
MSEGRIDLTMSDTGRVSIHNSLYSRYSRNHVEGVSVEVCHIMTLLGYGEETRRRRVEKYRENDMLWNAQHLDSTFITAGSKAEGLTCWLESDHDLLFMPKGVLCVEAGIDLHTIPDEIEVYMMDTRAYPGHCRMLLERCDHTHLHFDNKVLCDDGNGNTLLSSGLLLDVLSKRKFNIGAPLERAGPSLPRLIGQEINIDLVFAVHCQCPGILQRWAQRSRHWPPPDVVQKVVSLGSVVTPIGFRGSEFKYFEWRICFNMGETELVNNLTETQAKVYVLLKMIVKEVLKPKKKEITSFVLKSLIFWQAERNATAMFKDRNLIQWLHDALGTLRTVISSTQLPYYMIPERNLMAACGLQEEQQRKWVADIADMMEEGPRVILRLPKIRRAIICHPEPLLWFSRKRLEMEMLRLEWMIRFEQSRRDANGECDFSDIILTEIQRRMNEIALVVCLRMFMEGGIVTLQNDIFSSLLM